MDQVWNYYKELLKDEKFPVASLREMAIVFLLPFVPAGRAYLGLESWDRLVLGLHVREVKVCAGCFQIKPYADFTSLAGDRCAPCRAELKRQYNRDRRTKEKARQLRYKLRYRPKILT